jgi:hypothetical protein
MERYCKRIKKTKGERELYRRRPIGTKEEDIK